jgi:hypothetical protein
MTPGARLHSRRGDNVPDRAAARRLQPLADLHTFRQFEQKFMVARWVMNPNRVVASECAHGLD